MKTLLKRVIAGWLFRSGKPRRILLGPLRGLRFRPSPITGLAPFYSGAERFVQRAFAENLREGQVALDVGANWGLHTLFMAQLVGPHGKVWAFEPFPPVYKELEDHVRMNDMQTVITCFPVALGDSNGERFFVPGALPTTGHFLPGNGQRPVENMLSVRASRLDDLPEVAGLSRLDLVKIDVEGAESEVLAGAGNTIFRTRPVLIIELHTPDQDVAVARWLLDHEYKFQRLSEGPPIQRFDVGWPEPTGVWGTLIAHPTEKVGSNS